MSTTAKTTWRTSDIGAGDDPVWDRWDEFIDHHYGGHPMLDSRFVRSSIEHFGNRDLRLLRFGTREEDRVMMIVEPRRAGVFGTFAPGQSQIAPLLVHPGEAIDTGAMLAGISRRCLRLDLFNVDPDYFRATFQDEGPVERSVYGVTTNVLTRQTFEQFWSQRPKKLRDNIKRYRRRCEEESGIEFVVHTEPDDVQSALIRYGELESSGWKGRAGTAIHPSNPQGAFYASLLSKYAAGNQAFAFEFYLEGQLVASRLAVASGRMLVMLKTTFDEERSRFAPGRVALYETLHALFADPRLETIEMYTNAKREQLDWADGSREISNISIYPAAFVRRGVHVSRLLLRRKSLELNYTLEQFDSFEALPKDAVRLWHEFGREAIFSSLDWYQNLYEHVGADLGSLRLFVLSNKAEEVQAILPCVASAPPDGGAGELMVLANYYSPRFDLVVNEGSISREAAVRRIVAALSLRSDWTALTLFPLHGGADLDAFRAAAASYLLPSACFEETANWSVDIEDIGAYAESLPTLLRRTLKRKRSKLERTASYRYAIVTSPREAAAVVDDFRAVYDASWKPHEPYAGFIDGLVTLASRNGWLRLGLLYIDETPVAGQIWLVCKRTAAIYKLAYDQHYSEYSPGTLLTMHLLRHVVENDGVTTVDYLTGDDAYKRDWMSTRRMMYRLRIANPRLLRGAYLSVYDALRRLKERLT